VYVATITTRQRPIDAAALRAELARRRIPRSALADAAGLNRCYLSGLLTGRVVPGELAVRRLRDAVTALGIVVELEPQEADHAG
jgi:hypothetical protein